MSAEVASTRLPKEILREIDREAARRGISRSVYLADIIERGALREPSADGAATAEALASELREIREGQRSLTHALRDLHSALKAGGFPSSAASPCGASAAPAGPAIIDRVMFSTFFSETLIKRVSALLNRNPGELSQMVREAREQAEAEAKLWRERLQRTESPKGSS